jgi:hypothetical protein
MIDEDREKRRKHQRTPDDDEHAAMRIRSHLRT